MGFANLDVGSGRLGDDLQVCNPVKGGFRRDASTIDFGGGIQFDVPIPDRQVVRNH